MKKSKKKTPPVATTGRFRAAPWSFIRGRSNDPNRVLSLKPHGEMWAVFLEIELTNEARTLRTGEMYRLTGVPESFGASYVCLKRLYGTKAHLVGIAVTQEPLILLTGTLDPDKAVLLDMALSGAIPIAVIDDHLVVSSREQGELYVTDRESITVSKEASE